MKTFWTGRRWVGFAVHAALALLLLVWSISSSLHFWEFAFKDAIYSYGAVIVLDGLALLGFALHLGRIKSPLSYARHALPLVSAVPLVFDMHQQFVHLGDGLLTWSFTACITGLLVALSFVVWRTIEQMFIDPVEAAREYAEQRMQALVTTSEQMQVMQQAADGFVHMHQQRALQSIDALQPMHLPVESYARFPEPVQASYASMHEDASPVMHDASWQCIKCDATNVAEAGKNPMSCRKASGRYGCPQCK